MSSDSSVNTVTCCRLDGWNSKPRRGNDFSLHYYVHPAYSLMVLDVLTVEGNS
jgi:hypothetical protein